MANSAATFVSALSDICRKRRRSPCPDYDIVEEGDGNVSLYKVKCEAKGIVGHGESWFEEIAKQLAAKEIIRQLIEKNEFEGFGLCKSVEEAAHCFKIFADKLDAEEELSITALENFALKLELLCNRHKIVSPTYSFVESERASGSGYTTTCALGITETVGDGRKETHAKRLSAQKMISELEKIGLSLEDKHLLSFDEALELSRHLSDPSARSTVPDRVQASSETASGSGESTKVRQSKPPLMRQGARANITVPPSVRSYEGILIQLLKEGSDKVKCVFVNQEPEYPDSCKTSQQGYIARERLWLALQQPNGEKRGFPGYGMDEKAAREEACQLALGYLKASLP